MVNGIELERVDTTKFLGVMVNENLDWSAHTNYICNGISKSTAILAKLKHYVPKHVLLTINNSLCMSHISYAISVWGGSPATILKRMNVLQKKGIRHVCNAKYNSHTEPLFKQCNVLNIADLYKLSCVKLMYKKNKGLIHTYHASILPIKSQSTETVTRQAYDVVMPHQKYTRLYKTNSLNYKIGYAWNELPLDIKERSSKVQLTTFTRSVKSLYLSKYDDRYKCNDSKCYSCKDLVTT